MLLQSSSLAFCRPALYLKSSSYSLDRKTEQEASGVECQLGKGIADGTCGGLNMKPVLEQQRRREAEQRTNGFVENGWHDEMWVGIDGAPASLFREDFLEGIPRADVFTMTG